MQMGGQQQPPQQINKLEESMQKLQDQLNQLSQQLVKNPQQVAQQETKSQAQSQNEPVKEEVKSEQKPVEETKQNIQQEEIANLHSKIQQLEDALAKKQQEEQKQEVPAAVVQKEEQKAQEIPPTEVVQQQVEQQQAPAEPQVDRSALRLELQQIIEQREIKVDPDDLVTKAKIKNAKKLKPEELSFFQDISPLLLGIKCFKKPAKPQPFDPLLGHIYTPQKVGYEERKFQLQKTLNKIDPLFISKKGGDPAIPLENIKSIQFAPQTAQLIQLQNQLKESLFSNSFDPVELEQATQQYQSGSADQSSEEYATLALHCKYYEVHLISLKGPKLEIITDNTVYAQQLISGVEALIKQKKNIAKLKANVG